MLKPSDLKDLPIIARLACDCLADSGITSLLIQSIYWDTEKESWIVDCINSYESPVKISVAIQPYGGSYRYRGVVR